MSWLLSPIGSVASLDVVADVTLSAIGAGELLQWNGSAWINQTLAEIGVGTGDAVLADNEVVTGAWAFQNAAGMAIMDAGGTDYVTQSHDGTDYNIVGTNTTDINVTGITSFNVPALASTGAVTGSNLNIATWDALVSNATHTGDVTGSGALTIAAKAVDIAMLADGTDGELVTWSAAGVATTVPVGTATHVLTSNGVGTAPTFQAAAGGGAASVTKHKTADETVTSSTTYQADNHLDGFAMDADSYYKIEGCLHLTGHASGDYKSYFLFSNAVQLLNYQFHNVHSNAGHYVDAGGVGATSVVLSVNTTVLHSVAIIGFIKSNAVTGGTFGLQWAQNASYATGTTLHAGSWITITKIA